LIWPCCPFVRSVKVEDLAAQMILWTCPLWDALVRIYLRDAAEPSGAAMTAMSDRRESAFLIAHSQHRNWSCSARDGTVS
jgi:hypothetical protein